MGQRHARDIHFVYGVDFVADVLEAGGENVETLLLNTLKGLFGFLGFDARFLELFVRLVQLLARLVQFLHRLGKGKRQS